MGDITLVLLAMHRPPYFRRCLDSWGAARGSGGLRVMLRIGRTTPQTEQELAGLASMAATRYGWNLTTALDEPEDQTHTGPDRALGLTITAAFSEESCGFVIECDEDIVVSDDVLDYVAFARSLGPDCVCIHNDKGQGWSKPNNDVDADQQAVQICSEFTSWCFGFSREKWEQLWLPEWDWDRTSGNKSTEHGWEWQMHRMANRDSLRMVVPDASRCVNIGQYGGTFSHPGQFAGTVAQSFRKHRGAVYRLA